MIPRDELAARFAVPLIQEQCRALNGSGRVHEVMPTAFALADAFNATSALAKSAKYEPKVGDVVSIWPWAYEVVYTGLDNDRHEIRGFVLVDYATRGERRATTWDSGFVKLAYLRPATPAERIAAGIDPAPASEATPTLDPVAAAERAVIEAVERAYDGKHPSGLSDAIDALRAARAAKGGGA